MTVKCPICGKESKNKNSLNTHRWSKHPQTRQDKPPAVECPYCGQLKVKLQEHIENMHQAELRRSEVFNRA